MEKNTYILKIIIDERSYRAYRLNDEGHLMFCEIDFTEDWNMEKVGGWVVYNYWKEETGNNIPNRERIMKLLGGERND
tara:strand:- start:489 stop:722 length:234 start_codon:yes stop_codon:yes gene_type:complete